MASSLMFAASSSSITAAAEIHGVRNLPGRAAIASCSYSSSVTTTRATLTMVPNYTSTVIPTVPAAAPAKTVLPKRPATIHHEDGESSSTIDCPVPPGATLADVWREIQGAGDWSGLIDSLHPLLRAEIVRYGEMVNACYKAFDMDPKSKRFHNCKYGKRALLRETSSGVPPGYEVTKYIYAAAPDIGGIVGGLQPSTSGSCSGRWIGYVAVSGDSETRRLGRRDIVVAFRGTVTQAEWAANFMSAMAPARFDPHDPRPDVKVESGFLGLYTSCSSDESRFGHGSCREQLLCEIARLLDHYGRGSEEKEEVSVTIAGHSMGSSLALLLAYDLAELGFLSQQHRGRPHVPVTVYSFAGPRVGNLGFRRRCEELGVKVLRVANVNDPVTKLPGVFVNETNHGDGVDSRGRGFVFPWGGGARDCYAHVGVEVVLDFFRMEDPTCVHDLGHYLNLLRCPHNKKPEAKAVGEKGDMIKQMMQSLGNRLPKMDPTKWSVAAVHMGNLAQSLGF